MGCFRRTIRSRFYYCDVIFDSAEKVADQVQEWYEAYRNFYEHCSESMFRELENEKWFQVRFNDIRRQAMDFNELVVPILQKHGIF
ncbi:hypothetical protein AB9M62_17125 [Bacillales bacterium AN1005]